jgi:hypothetical protein
MRLFFLFFCGILLADNIKGQNINPTNTANINPPSPEVAALGKYIDMPVSYSTGVPGITIPFYTVKSGSLQVPISINYNASGIKVEEASTWTGLGWTLSAGGNISRVVQGLPDDYGPNGYMSTTKTVKYILGLPLGSAERYNLLYIQANNAELDVEPDMYFFSAGNYSGKFYFDQDARNFVLTPYQNIIISHTKDANNNIISFKLTLPDGTQCYFGKSKDNLRTGYDKSNGQEVTISSGGTLSFPPAGNAISSHITSWQIMDLVSSTGNQIGFQYVSYNDIDFGRSGETRDYAGASGCTAATGETNASYYRQYNTKTRLDKITGELEEVIFVPSLQTRLDVGFDGKSLEKLLIKNKHGQQIKGFEMEYDYFISSGADGLPGLADMAEKARRRLYLKLVRPVGATTESTSPYLFTYETSTPLPSRFSASQDFWGYYNGNQINGDLIPKVSSYLLYGTFGGFLPGADRTVDFNFAKAGVLKKVTYPTGGTAEYFFEPNKVSPNYLQSILSGYQQSGLENKQFNFFRSGLFQQGIDINLYRGTFTITNVAGETQITSFFEGCPNGFNYVDCPVIAHITGITNPAFQLTINDPNFYVNIPVGTYQLEVVITPNENYPAPDFNIAVKWLENPDPNNILVGGLRLAKIISDNGGGSKITKSFSYQSFANPVQSSGELINMPVHAFNIPCGTVSTGNVLRLVSNSAVPLSSPDGQLVRYTNITEYYDENKSSFKTEYNFSIDHYNFVDPNGSNYPFPTNLQRDWRSGLLLEKNEYEKQVNGTFRLLKKEVNNYNAFQTRYENIFGIKLAPYPAGGGTFGYTPYSFVSERYLPASVQSTVTSYNGTSPSSLIMTQDLFYNNQYQLAIQRNQNSKGEVTTVNLKYPNDFALFPPYNEMISRNIITPLIEEKVINVTLNNKELSNTKTNYLSWQSNTFIEPASIQKSILGNALQTEMTINDYDNKGNVLQVTGKDGIVTSYIWGYSQHYPVAKIIGKTYADAVSQSGIILSVVDNAAISDVAMRGELNKIRQLNNCFVTTYTYKPLVGITSETDVNGKMKYYEYDILNRLKLIRDQDNNILKKICYNYAGQLENCNQ